jgi:hypothetical protein
VIIEILEVLLRTRFLANLEELDTCHASALSSLSFMAAEIMTDSTSSDGTPSVMTMTFMGLIFLSSSNRWRYDFRILFKR